MLNLIVASVLILISYDIICDLYLFVSLVKPHVHLLSLCITLPILNKRSASATSDWQHMATFSKADTTLKPDLLRLLSISVNLEVFISSLVNAIKKLL